MANILFIFASAIIGLSSMFLLWYAIKNHIEKLLLVFVVVGSFFVGKEILSIILDFF